MKRAVSAGFVACGVAAFAMSVAAQGGAGKVTVTLADAAGKTGGHATITEPKMGAGVAIALDLTGLPAREHAIHIPQNAKGDGRAFTTAGGHFNPAMKKHGLESPDGPHAGDMKNLTVAANGTAKVTVTDERVTLGTGANSLFTNGGTAIVIHA